MKELLDKAVKAYELAFCKQMKHQIGEWIYFGRLYTTGDLYFSFDDMRFIVDNNIPAKKVIQHYDYCMESEKSISLASWLKGERHPKKKVYLSAPITGKDLEETFLQFAKAEIKATKAGYEPINPLRIGIQLFGEDADWIKYIVHDIKLLQKCDYIWFFSGEPDSNGVAIERAIADNFGIKTIEL